RPNDVQSGGDSGRSHTIEQLFLTALFFFTIMFYAYVIKSLKDGSYFFASLTIHQTISPTGRLVVHLLQKTIILRVLIPIGFLVAFIGWILYRLLIKKDFRQNLNSVGVGLFFFGVWAVLYFFILKF
ncbi:MAG TPA: hypothetical protein VGF30_15595, partial [Bacteroidia bacterium]